jgi:hypothetical protein
MSISETVSDKPKRGRPRITTNINAHGRTRRTVLNRHYAMRALGVLVAAAPDLHSWYNGQRATILSELGQVENPSTLVAWARYFQASGMTTRQAIATFRRVQGVQRPGSAEGLAKVIFGTLRDYLRCHPDLAGTDVADAFRVAQARWGKAKEAGV